MHFNKLIMHFMYVRFSQEKILSTKHDCQLDVSNISLYIIATKAE